MTRSQIKAFQKRVYAQAKSAARVYPWRPPLLRVRSDGSIDPYRILVSEIMLQQTQTARVVDYFKRFTKAYPTVRALAEAPLADVLRLWQGLGYNRRAKMLHACARIVVSEYTGRMPRERSVFLALPGIGPYTAGAVRAFAFNEPDVLIETNIRTVYTHHFFKNTERVTDAELIPLIDATLDHKQPRAWYSALMDYGALLKQSGVKLNSKSAQYTKQSKFEGSDRQIRGAILRYLAQRDATSRERLCKDLDFDSDRIVRQLNALEREQFVHCRGRSWALRS